MLIIVNIVIGDIKRKPDIGSEEPNLKFDKCRSGL